MEDSLQSALTVLSPCWYLSGSVLLDWSHIASVVNGMQGTKTLGRYRSGCIDRISVECGEALYNQLAGSVAGVIWLGRIRLAWHMSALQPERRKLTKAFVIFHRQLRQGIPTLRRRTRRSLLITSSNESECLSLHLPASSDIYPLEVVRWWSRASQ